MPERLGIDPLKEPPPRSPLERGKDDWVTTTEKMLVTAIVVIVFSFVAFAAYSEVRYDRLDEQITDNGENTSQNRAVSCRVLLALGQELSPDGPCYDPEVIRYYDPEDATAIRTGSFDLICAISEVVGVDAVRMVESDCPMPGSREDGG